ncbi:hypothetical protein BaRGS_00011477 [Batillaria attramentaria]|uniref:Secreted protein n=1 Tax=Batillaria attramentaria TaxID=370345 RepID=A0ABD0LCM6_9CAEN
MSARLLSVLGAVSILRDVWGGQIDGSAAASIQYTTQVSSNHQHNAQYTTKHRVYVGDPWAVVMYYTIWAAVNCSFCEPPPALPRHAAAAASTSILALLPPSLSLRINSKSKSRNFRVLTNIPIWISQTSRLLQLDSNAGRPPTPAETNTTPSHTQKDAQVCVAVRIYDACCVLL